MVKKMLLLGFFLAGMFSLAAQQNAGSDATAAKDSSVVPRNVPVNDPKQGFKNLFITSTTAAEINATRLNPQAISFVTGYIDKHGDHLRKMKDWGRPYFDMMDAILTQYGLPKELKYLAVIESYLKTYAVSWAGAVGPWQFMPATARRMGLRVTSYVDERTDYYKSTHAAARHLNELYALYNDWLLVIAAYNGGPGNVDKAIRRSGNTDFWKLQYYLPAESREHVKKFIATHYIMEGEGGITTLTKEEAKELVNAGNTAEKNLSTEELTNSKQDSISGKYNSLVIAKHITFDIIQFNRYNPDFDKLIAANGGYKLRLPADKMTLFMAKRYDILNESLQILLDNFRRSLDVPVKSPASKKTSGK